MEFLKCNYFYWLIYIKIIPFDIISLQTLIQFVYWFWKGRSVFCSKCLNLSSCWGYNHVMEPHLSYVSIGAKPLSELLLLHSWILLEPDGAAPGLYDCLTYSSCENGTSSKMSFPAGLSWLLVPSAYWVPVTSVQIQSNSVWGRGHCNNRKMQRKNRKRHGQSRILHYIIQWWKYHLWSPETSAMWLETAV